MVRRAGAGDDVCGVRRGRVRQVMVMVEGQLVFFVVAA
jgi:hypothetical protein